MDGQDGAGGLVGAPPRSWRRQVRRRATSATLLGEAKAASSQPPAARRAAGAGGTGAQRHGGAERQSQWRDRVLLAAEAALKERERDDRDDEIARRKGKV